MRNDCRFAFPFGCSSLLSVRSISQSSPFGTLIQVKLSRCPIFYQSVNEIDLKHFISAKLSIIPKQNHTKSNYDRYSFHPSLPLRSKLCYAMLCYTILSIFCFFKLLFQRPIWLGTLPAHTRRLKTPETDPSQPIYAIEATPKNAHMKY
jgi:hypothetical protein